MELAIIIILATGIGVGLVVRHRHGQQRAIAQLREAERLQLVARQDAEGRAAPLLVEAPDVDVEAFRQQVAALNTAFAGLQQFSDAVAWDDEACVVIEAIDVAARVLDSFADDAMAAVSVPGSPDEAPWVRASRVDRTKLAAERARIDAARLAKAADSLAVKVEHTPRDEAERRTILDELQTRRGILKAERQEAKAVVKELRRQADDAKAILKRHRRQAGWRMDLGASRSWRHEREAERVVEEDELDAVRRQLEAIDERIGWLQRFG